MNDFAHLQVGAQGGLVNGRNSFAAGARAGALQRNQANGELSMSQGWIGVDLDGTLAWYDHWRGAEHIGEPIPAMLERVKQWLAAGKDVRIFTARVHIGTVAVSMRNANGEGCRNVSMVEGHIQRWCQQHIGRVLPITCCKDYGMIELWDDRCVQVIPNTGRTIADELESQREARSGKVASPYE